ncbi:hypothetical protein DRO34_05755 [Candidatus Bathyarchaeota archaeon]|nr:MAG: hypothetical protein DRO34_05755 [Candidatus Bathyarchaeota archaeon]
MGCGEGMRKALIKIDFACERKAKTVFAALKPETLSQPTQRSNVEISLEGKKLVLIVKARDTTALRAAVNAYLRWVDSVQKVLEVIS